MGNWTANMCAANGGSPAPVFIFFALLTLGLGGASLIQTITLDLLKQTQIEIYDRIMGPQGARLPNGHFNEAVDEFIFWRFNYEMRRLGKDASASLHRLYFAYLCFLATGLFMLLGAGIIFVSCL